MRSSTGKRAAHKRLSVVGSCYNYDENPQWCEDHPSELVISDIKFFNLKGYASGQFPI